MKKIIPILILIVIALHSCVFESTCDSCTGSGKTTCITCSGSSKVICSYCNGLGDNKLCYACSGEGGTRCYDCSGDGNVSGTVSAEDGYRYVSVEGNYDYYQVIGGRVNASCKDCNGTGKKKCSNYSCKDGKIECSNYSCSDGKVKCTNYSCSDGKVECTLCKGKGKI
jgi:hypothetical protein